MLSYFGFREEVVVVLIVLFIRRDFMMLGGGFIICSYKIIGFGYNNNKDGLRSYT